MRCERAARVNFGLAGTLTIHVVVLAAACRSAVDMSFGVLVDFALRAAAVRRVIFGTPLLRRKGVRLGDYRPHLPHGQVRRVRDHATLAERIPRRARVASL